MIDELKPCPFCGEDAEHVHVCAYEEIVRCTNECCFVRPSVTCELPEECVELWNHRAAGASEGQAEPVAWITEDRGLTISEIQRAALIEHGGQYASKARKYSVPLYTHPSAEIAALRERIAELERDIELSQKLR